MGNRALRKESQRCLSPRGEKTVALENTRRRQPREEALHMDYIAFDAHARDTLVSVARPDSGLVREQRISRERGALQQCLERCEHGSPVAIEPIGHWYGIIDEIEAAGGVPALVHARVRRSS